VDWLIDKRLIVVFISIVILITVICFSIYAVTNQANQPESNNPTDKLEVDNSLGQIEFQTIAKGCYSGHKSSEYYVIQNEGVWSDIWNQLAHVFVPQPPPPEVNFSETTIIAVFMGEYNTGGYRIEIKEILDMNQSVVIKVEKICAGGVTLAFTQPYHIVKIAKMDKEITFETVERTIECP